MKEGEEETGRLRDKLKKLREKLRWHYNKVDNMEDENKNLQHEVRRLQDDLHQANDIQHGSASQGGAHTGLTSHDRRDVRSHRQSSLSRCLSPAEVPAHLIDRIGQSTTTQRTPSPRPWGEDIKMASPKVLKQATEEVEETATAQTSAQPPLRDEPATESVP